MNENFALETVALSIGVARDAGSASVGEGMRDAILTAAAVSFGFFGTLFHRSIATADEVFAILGRRFDLPEFPALRRAAQAEAVERMRQAGRREITLANIYDRLPVEPALAEALQAAELALELDVLRPDLVAQAAFHHALELGRPSLIIADTYLGRAFIREALIRHGLDPVALFISSDCNATTRGGDLFDLAADYLAMPRDRLLHIGGDLQAEIAQAAAKGFATFHYRCPAPPSPPATVETKATAEPLAPRELGYQVSGPAAVGFLNWLERQVKADGINQVLFLAPGGGLLERIVRENPGAWDLPPCASFQGSHLAFTLAAMNDQNFQGHLPFLVADSDGLAPYEVLERLGVPALAPEVMADYNLGDDVQLSTASHVRLLHFLYELRFEILKVCRRNRRGLFAQLKQLEARRGARVALVGLDWDGATQDALEVALQGLFELNIHGYSLCRAITGTQAGAWAPPRRADALLSTRTVAPSIIHRLYENRLLIDLLFGAPQDAIIGLDPGVGRVEVVRDERWEATGRRAAVISALTDGAMAFARDHAVKLRTSVPPPAVEMAWPLVEFVRPGALPLDAEIGSLTNVNAWTGTRNRQPALPHQHPWSSAHGSGR
ncbi:hypothetical protein [Nitrospirillum iridis]|nr:hypothetical protein [Nitrospirillum iridis]